MIHLTTGREFLTTKQNVKVKLTNIHKGVEEGSKSFFFVWINQTFSLQISFVETALRFNIKIKKKKN